MRTPPPIPRGRKRSCPGTPSSGVPVGRPSKRSFSAELLSPTRSFMSMTVTERTPSPPTPVTAPAAAAGSLNDSGEWLVRRRSAGSRTPSPMLPLHPVIPRRMRGTAAREASPPAAPRAPRPSGHFRLPPPRPAAAPAAPTAPPDHSHRRGSLDVPSGPSPSFGLEHPSSPMPTARQPRTSDCTPVKFPPLASDQQAYWARRVNEVVALRSLPDRDQPACLLPFLYLGTYKHSRAPALMERLGITHIINCATGTCPPIPDQYPHVSYTALDAEDTPTYPILAIMWEEVFALIEAARRSRGTVLLHCQAGVNRSATLAVAYCIAHHRWTLTQAVEHVFRLRPFILTNEFFHEQLVLFAHRCRLLG